ncbi:hypothetical protein [Chlamydia buteonis]|uniref:Uncharacterized protein n=1 Tax=Chlamydia buteonis TaxID=2494525 RepID=A0ABX8LEH5_9CHLA|nr:hypothetical protein [Chlamydia buteonis]QXE27035.1 hypothetical protein HBN95_02655 [Chlamydia buteonis]QXE28025.1 hypothetical protein JJJ19_00490 [Chlamydia buteonis]
MSNPVPTPQHKTLSSFPSTISLSKTDGNSSIRRSSLRLFLDTMLIVLGFSTVVSIFVAIFFLNGLSLLNTTTIVLTSVLMLIGIIFISVGVLFFVNNVEEGLSGILRKRLKEREAEIAELQNQLQTCQLNQDFSASEPSSDIVGNSKPIETDAEVTVEVR